MMVNNSVLTDALNATFRTLNGNEMLLQNDMGNTLIEDSTTGHIMSLSPGFIPVGVKEHGGVLYIASYNPKTKEGELGTIPSPLFNYEMSETSNNDINVKLTDIDESQQVVDLKYYQQTIQLFDTQFLPGDEFIVCLDIGGIRDEEEEEDYQKHRGHRVLQYIGRKNNESVYFPMYTRFENDKIKHGMFYVELIAQTNSNEEVVLDETIKEPQRYYAQDDNSLSGVQSSNYWFLPANTEIDQDRTSSANYYRVFPNIPSGWLYVRIKPNLPSDFQFFKNKTTQLYSPYITIEQ